MGIFDSVLKSASRPSGGLLADPSAPPVNDHSTRDRWLAFLAGGPAGLYGEIKGQEAQKSNQATMAGYAQMLGLGPPGQSGAPMAQPGQSVALAAAQAPPVQLDPAVGLQPDPPPAGGGMAPSGPPPSVMDSAPRLPSAAAPQQGGAPSPDSLRKYLALQSLVAGKPKDTWDILQDDVTQGTDGTLYSKHDGRTIGRLPNHQMVNGFNVDLGAPGAPSFVPQLPNGTMPDGKGGVVNMAGLAAAMGQQTGATEDAKNASEARYAGPIAGARAGAAAAAELPYVGPRSFAQARGDVTAKAPYDMVTLTGKNNVPFTVSRATAAALGANGGVVAQGQGPADTAYQTSNATSAAGQFQGMQKDALAAPGKIANLHQLGSLLDGMNTGKLTPAGVEIASAMRSVLPGFDAKLGNKEAAAAISNRLVLDSMGGSLGTGISNADRSFVEKQTPRLGQTPQGRKILVDMAVAVENRKVAVADFAARWQQHAGRLDVADAHGVTFAGALAKWSASHPLFSHR